MLDRFKVPEDIAVRVQRDDMFGTMKNVFAALGMPEPDSAQAAEVLLYADSRGIDSHGVSNMTPAYVSWLRKGRVNPTPSPKIERELGAIVTVDCDGGFGLSTGPAIMDMAIERARQFGVGVGIAFNAAHYGAAAYYAHRALPHDMIGISMTTGGVYVTPTQGAERLLGLNPIGIAVPSDREVPYIFDASMSSIAANKIALLKRVGEPALPGWVTGPDGAPIMQEAQVPDDFMVLPLGGTREIGSHKGYGLMLMVEVLTSVLAGMGGGPFRRTDSAHYFMAYNVAAFCDLATFKKDMDEYLRRLLDCKPAPGETRVVYPGIPEHETQQERQALGIPYHPDVVDWFKGTCAEIGAEHHL